jgi:hypothetical protein
VLYGSTAVCGSATARGTRGSRAQPVSIPCACQALPLGQEAFLVLESNQLLATRCSVSPLSHPHTCRVTPACAACWCFSLSCSITHHMPEPGDICRAIAPTPVCTPLVALMCSWLLQRVHRHPKRPHACYNPRQRQAKGTAPSQRKSFARSSSA